MSVEICIIKRRRDVACNVSTTTTIKTGCSADGYTDLLWKQVFAGSNPATQTSTRSLLNTAKLMEDNAMLWKLKEMEYVEKIADKVNTISVSGNGQILEQLKQIFVSQKV